MEGVEDDRRPRVAGQARRGPADGAGLRGVRVQDVRPPRADQLDEARDRERVVDHRDLAVQLRQAHDLDAGRVGDERHRALAAREAAGDELRVVAALAQTGREVGDVERRPAHVQSGDHAQDADRLGGRSAQPRHYSCPLRDCGDDDDPLCLPPDGRARRPRRRAPRPAAARCGRGRRRPRRPRRRRDERPRRQRAPTRSCATPTASRSTARCAGCTRVCSGDWILNVDDDEVPSEELLAALPELIAAADVTHYWLLRRWLWPDAARMIAEHPWTTDYQLRLVQNDPRLLALPGRDAPAGRGDRPGPVRARAALPRRPAAEAARAPAGEGAQVRGLGRASASAADR